MYSSLLLTVYINELVLWVKTKTKSRSSLKIQGGESHVPYLHLHNFTIFLCRSRETGMVSTLQ